MNRLFIVRHAEPEVDPSFPAAMWPLSASGRQAARALAFDLARWSPGFIVTSPERKALETGNEMLAVLDLGVTSNDDLQEQGLGTVPFLADPATFEVAVHEHFHDPLQAVLGDESSAASARRLEHALAGILAAGPSSNGPLIVVTHGRILASFLSRLTGKGAVSIWQSLRLPDAMMVDLERKTFSAIQ